MRGLEALAATDLHAAMSPHRQTCLLQGGGPGSGTFWSTVPDRPALRTPNSQWAFATKSRLGVCTAPQAGLTCCLQNKGDDDPCGEPLDSQLHHSSVCRAGAGRLRCHTAAVAVLAKHLRATGAAVALEAAVPELYVVDAEGKVHERFMDLLAWWPGGSRRFLLDITIRSPFAADLTNAHIVPGAAARAGERDKIGHYGPTVVPFAVEQGGRLGASAQQAVMMLHRESTEFGRMRPGGGRAAVLNLRRLRADLEAEVVRHVAQTGLAALGGQALRALGWASAAERWRRARRPGGAGERGGGGGGERGGRVR